MYVERSKRKKQNEALKKNLQKQSLFYFLELIPALEVQRYIPRAYHLRLTFSKKQVQEPGQKQHIELQEMLC